MLHRRVRVRRRSTGVHITRKQRFTLVAAILGSSVAAIDGTIVNVALPAIQADLGGGLQAQQWVSNAYLLTLGSLILIGGSLGDIYGRRRVFAIGVGSFGVLSLACAVAPTVETLIAARALQGVAGALLTPSSLAIIAAAFSDRERGAAIGSWTAWGGIAIIVGPLAGGLIVDQTSWRWIFAINVPLVVVTLVLVRAAVPDAPTVPRRVDVIGACLCALGPRRSRLRSDRAATLRLGEPRGHRLAARRRRLHSGVSSSTRSARRTRCCDSTCSSAGTSRSPTCRRSRSTRACRCCSSSCSSSSSRSPATRRCRRG